MYKGIAGSEGIGIGNVVIIEEHEIVIENKKITDTDAEIARLQGAEVCWSMSDRTDRKSVV